MQGIGDAAPSELSSQIRQTVALETSTSKSTDPAAVAPIATMLKPADPVPMPADKPDAAGRHPETAVPTPEPADHPPPPSHAPPAPHPATYPQTAHPPPPLRTPSHCKS